jgi:hypothetical protein
MIVIARSVLVLGDEAIPLPKHEIASTEVHCLTMT